MIVITNEREADAAFSRIYFNQDEATDACSALTIYYEDDPLVVYEIDEPNGYMGRGFIIVCDDPEDEDLQRDLRRSHAELVTYVPAHTLQNVETLTYEQDDQHVEFCGEILALCPLCSQAFGIKAFPV